MEKADYQESKESVNLLSLPVELLVYIMSFLRVARDLLKLRYVSRRLRAAAETPSLWSEFVWPLYDPREERSVMNVLKDFGEYIKLLIFPNHVEQSKLLEMINRCRNVTHLTLPAVTELDLDKLKGVVKHMTSLEKLEVRLNSCYIEPLLLIGGLKELTIHVIEKDYLLCAECVEEWMSMGYMPPNLVLITKHLGIRRMDFLSTLLTNTSIPPKDCLCCFTLHYDGQVPLNLFSAIPAIRLEFGQSTTCPFIKASSYGILGLNKDVLLLTEYVKDGKALCKAEVTILDNVPDEMINNSVKTLKFVTEFWFGYADPLYPGHLEQLAFACPNLEHLDLAGRSECLHNLQGLRTIAQHCKNLHRLNLMLIPLNKIGSVRELWEILSSMSLTCLCVEICIFEFCKYSITSEQPLTKSLQALQIDASYKYESHADYLNYLCAFCKICEVDWSLLSNFSVLKYCRLFSEDPNAIQDITIACKELVCLYCEAWKQPLFTSLCYSKLEQLCINSVRTDIPTIVMNTISAHGRLVRVVMYVHSVTAEGIISLITNSPGLLTLIIVTRQHVYNEQNVRVHAKDIRAAVKKTFPHRKLFSVGDYRLLQENDSFEHWHIESFLYGTDLQPL